MRRMSLRVRIGIAAAAAVALAVMGVAIAAYAGTRSQLRGQVDHSLQDLSRTVLNRVAGPPGRGRGPGPPPPADGRRGARGPLGSNDPDEGLGLDQLPGQAFGGAPGTFTLVYPSGTTYVPTGQQYRIPAGTDAKRIAASGTGQAFTDMHVSGHHIRVLITGIGTRGAIEAALPLTDVDNALSNQLVLLIVIAAAGIALAAVFGIVVARTALLPIARFTRRTEAVAASASTELADQRLEVHGRDELARLAQTFNTTLDALERSVHAQRNLVADASHELRTPIATIRANLQLMRDEAQLAPADRAALRDDVIAELDELTALVSDIVELARGSKQATAPSELRLDAIVAEALERARRRAPELTFTAELEPTLIEAEGERVARAVANLLDNARKWSPPRGVIEVRLEEGMLTVRDHGPGFSQADLPFVFDRFHRARAARAKPGSGLGLAIVRQAAEAHGGFVHAANAPDGGAVVTVGFGASEVVAAEPERGHEAEQGDRGAREPGPEASPAQTSAPSPARRGA